MKALSLRHGVALAITALWAVALFRPALLVNGYQSFGWSILLVGWLGTMLGQIDWLGNPILLGLLVMLLQRRAPRRGLACTGVLLAIVLARALLRKTVMIDESGNQYPIVAHFVGYYLWLAAIGLGAVAASAAVAWPQRMGFVSLSAPAPLRNRPSSAN